MQNYLLTNQESARLIYRKLKQSDFDLWLPFHQDPISNEHWSKEDPDPIIACQQWFDAVFDRYKNNLGGMNALIHKTTQEFIGQCGLLIQTVDGIEELEIGYSILPKYWNYGYASEAAQECKSYALKNKLGKSLISIIHIANIKSQKVALNNGMYLDKTTTYKNNPVSIFRINL